MKAANDFQTELIILIKNRTVNKMKPFSPHRKDIKQKVIHTYFLI